LVPVKLSESTLQPETEKRPPNVQVVDTETSYIFEEYYPPHVHVKKILKDAYHYFKREKAPDETVTLNGHTLTEEDFELTLQEIRHKYDVKDYVTIFQVGNGTSGATIWRS
jgi:hypothetical protein